MKLAESSPAGRVLTSRASKAARPGVPGVGEDRRVELWRNSGHVPVPRCGRAIGQR